MKFEIDITDDAFNLIKTHINEVELLDIKNTTDEEILYKIFWLPEVDPNFEIEDDIKIIKIEETQDVKKELDVVCKALKVDESYYMSWQANIAMAFYDEYNKYYNENLTGSPDKDDLHKIANNAAKNFLNLLINK